MQLKPEGGVTHISLENARELIGELGTPDTVQLVNEGSDTGEHVVFATWENPDGDDITHKFTGFSWGYRGEGPHGLATFFDMIGLATRIPQKTLFSLPSTESGVILSLTRSEWQVEFASDGVVGVDKSLAVPQE